MAADMAAIGAMLNQKKFAESNEREDPPGISLNDTVSDVNVALRFVGIDSLLSLVLFDKK